MALMTDDTGERTEMPTVLRLDEARQRGQVARSSDLVTASLLLGSIAVLAAWGPGLGRALVGMTVTFLSPVAGGPLRSPVAAGAWPAIRPVLMALAPIICIPAAIAVGANLLQIGALASADPIKPDLRRILPSAGLRRMLSTRSLVRAAMAVAKIAIVAGIFLVTARPLLGRMLSSAVTGPGALAADVGSMSCRLAVRLAVALMALSLLDWLYQRWQWRQDLKITRRQLLDDLRRMEADPKIVRRRQAQARRLADRMKQLNTQGATDGDSGWKS